jgi:hypothetical protein
LKYGGINGKEFYNQRPDPNRKKDSMALIQRKKTPRTYRSGLSKSKLVLVFAEKNAKKIASKLPIQEHIPIVV